MSLDPQRVESLVYAALALSPQERIAYLDRTCGDDAELRQHVEKVLQVHEQAGDFLQPPLAAESASAPPPPGQWLDRDATTPPSESAGKRLGSYKLLQKLGEGGMGVVWMAEQTEPVHRRVAVKVIKSGLDSAQVVARFEQERQALALMDHPNIARVLDAGATAEGLPFVVMELVKGVPITKYCDQEQRSPKERLELFVPVCQAVQHAHQKGIIHRDLKPSNVLIALYDGRPVPKVIDFGVAKATGPKLTDKTLFTEVGQIVGTLEYMSPEQAELNNLDIDTRADIYSLGVLLYELLTGSPPFTGRQLRSAAFAEMLRIIREVEPAKPSTKLSSSEELPSIAAKRKLEPKRLTKLVHGDLDWITMKCLEKERSRRYETANGLALDLQRYLADEPVLAGPPSLRYRLRKYVRRHRGPVLAAGLVLLALVGGISGTTLGLLRAEAAWRAEQEQRRLAEQERDDKERALKEAETNAKEAKQQKEAAQQQKRQADNNAKEANRLKEIAEKQKRETQEQAAIAQVVNDFLQNDLLGQADVGQQMFGPQLQRDPDVKVRTLLERAAKTIEGKFQDQPLTEAAIRQTIGSTFMHLGRYEEAQPHLERALQLRLRQLGPDDLNTLYTRNDLALLYGNQGNYKKAETLLEETLQGYTIKLGADHRDTLAIKHNLARLFALKGQYDRAELLFSEVVQKLTAQRGGEDLSTLSSKDGLADVYRRQSKYKRAEALWKEVLQARTAKLGADHPATLESKSGLVVLYWDQGQFDRAEKLCEEVVQARLATRGADHPETLTSKSTLAELYLVHGKYDKAETLLKEVVRITVAKQGADHPDTLVSKANLAGLYGALRQFDKAEPILNEVLRAQTAKLGADHPHTLVTKNNLAALYWNLGRLKESVPLFEEVLRAHQKKLGPNHINTLRTMANLGINYRDAGRIKDAIPLLEEVVQRADKRPGGCPPSLTWVSRALAETYDLAGLFTKSEPIYRTYVEQYRNTFGNEHPATAGQLALLGYNLLRQKKYAEAEPVLRDCLTIREKKQPDLWTIFGTRSMLGEALAGQKKYAEAEPLLLQGYEGMKQREKTIPPQGKVRLAEAVERLVQLYDAWGKKDKANEWRKKLAEARKTAPTDPRESRP